MEVTDNEKHTRLLQHVVNYYQKSFSFKGIKYKTFRISNLRKLYRFCIRLVPFYVSCFHWLGQNQLAYYRITNCSCFYCTGLRAQCYKSFDVCNLRIFILINKKNYSIGPGRTNQSKFAKIPILHLCLSSQLHPLKIGFHNLSNIFYNNYQ